MTAADLSSPQPVPDPSCPPVELLVDVPGVPVPQGSMRGYGRRIVADNAKDLRPWRAAITAHAKARIAVTGWRMVDGPCEVSATFWFPRPPAAARRLYPHTPPDIDKLLRALFDGLTDAGVWRSDARVTDLGRVVKRYAAQRPGMRVRIVDLTGQPTLEGPGSGLAATQGDETGPVAYRVGEGPS